MSSSTSAITATEIVDVWILPPDSVSGTRCTLCTPDSYFIIEYAPAPVIVKVTDFIPPIPVSSHSTRPHFQPLPSA